MIIIVFIQEPRYLYHGWAFSSVVIVQPSWKMHFVECGDSLPRGSKGGGESPYSINLFRWTKQTMVILLHSIHGIIHNAWT